MRKVRPAFVVVSAFVAAALSSFLLAGAASATTPPVYQVHPIGFPPGVAGTGAMPVALNDAGQVAETGFPQPWFYDGSAFAQLPGDPSPCAGFQPADMNNQGWIVGTLGCGGFLFRNGATQSIGANLVPTGVADNGPVVGIDQRPGNNGRAFVWTGGVATDIVGTDGTQSVKAAPNGVIAGSVQSPVDGTFQLFLQDSSGLSFFSLPASIDPLADIVVTGVNSGGTAVMAIDSTAYEFDRGNGFVPIPEPSDGQGTFSNPMAINDSGVVVGEYNYVISPGADQSGLFVFTNGTSVDLGAQHSVAGDLTDVLDVDSAGNILGAVCTAGPSCQAAILTPPTSAVALGLAAAPDTAGVLVGGETGYTVTIQNGNGIPVSLDSLSVKLPAALAYETGTTSGATSSDPAVAAGVLTWTGPLAVPASGSATLHFLVAVSPSASPGTVTIDLSGSAAGYTVTPAPGVAPVAITGPGPGKGLKLKAKVDQEVITIGSADGWTITVQDTGDKPATLVSLVVTLRPGFAYKPGSTSGLTSADPHASGQTLTWHGLMTIPAKGPGATLHFGVTTGPGSIGKWAIDVSGSADVAVTPETQIGQVKVKG